MGSDFTLRMGRKSYLSLSLSLCLSLSSLFSSLPSALPRLPSPPLTPPLPPLRGSCFSHHTHYINTRGDAQIHSCAAHTGYLLPGDKSELGTMPGSTPGARALIPAVCTPPPTPSPKVQHRTPLASFLSRGRWPKVALLTHSLSVSSHRYVH